MANNLKENENNTKLYCSIYFFNEYQTLKIFFSLFRNETYKKSSLKKCDTLSAIQCINV